MAVNRCRRSLFISRPKHFFFASLFRGSSSNLCHVVGATPPDLCPGFIGLNTSGSKRLLPAELERLQSRCGRSTERYHAGDARNIRGNPPAILQDKHHRDAVPSRKISGDRGRAGFASTERSNSP